jgi:hypothetical protein
LPTSVNATLVHLCTVDTAADYPATGADWAAKPTVAAALLVNLLRSGAEGSRRPRAAAGRRQHWSWPGPVDGGWLVRRPRDISFQRTRTWKESNDQDEDAKPDESKR